MPRRLVHCWKSGPLLWVGHDQFASGVCMLRDGHPGPCEFTRDDEIQIGIPAEVLAGEESLVPQEAIES